MAKWCNIQNQLNFWAGCSHELTLDAWFSVFQKISMFISRNTREKALFKKLNFHASLNIYRYYCCCCCFFFWCPAIHNPFSSRTIEHVYFMSFPCQQNMPVRKTSKRFGVVSQNFASETICYGWYIDILLLLFQYNNEIADYIIYIMYC